MNIASDTDKNSFNKVGPSLMPKLWPSCIISNAAEHINMKNSAIDDGLIPLSSSARSVVNVSRTTNAIFLGYAVFTQASNSKHKKSTAVIQCSVDGKRNKGFIFI